MRWSVFVALGLVGCAIAAQQEDVLLVRRGAVTPGGPYLVTITVAPLDRVAAFCRSERALACTWTVPVRVGDHDVRTVHQLIARRSDVPRTFYELMAHEECHAIALTQRLSDPCHAEDGGVLR